MAAVDVRNVVKLYRRQTEELRVLDGLSLSIPDGSFVALMGPSGSGKTTLLNLIGGVDQPTSGDLLVAGTNIAKLKGAHLARWRSSSIGYVFQLYNLIPVLTAQENVELPLLLVRMSGPERRKRAQTAPGSSITRGSSRAARSSASPSRAPSSPIPRCCSPTSPRATSTASRPRRCSSSCPGSTANSRRPSSWSRTTRTRPSEPPRATTSTRACCPTDPLRRAPMARSVE